MRDIVQDLLGNVFLLLAVCIVARRMPRRRLFAGRMALSLAMVCALRFAYFYLIKPPWLAAASALFARELLNTLGYTLLILLITACAAFCFEAEVWPALFCGCASYCVQHICQRLYRMLSRTWLRQAPEAAHILVYIAVAAVCLAGAAVLLRKLRVDKIVVDNKMLLLAVLAVVSTAIALDLMFFRAMQEGGELLQLCFTAYSIMASVLIFFLLLGIVSSKRAKLERDTIKEVLKSEQER